MKKTYDNGLRLVTKSLANTEAVTVLILVGAGSRYESKDINGISHFLEHMFFKGAEKYKNTKEVSEAIDSVGGEFNAFTSNEYAGYYVKLAADKIDTALSVLSDMLLNSKFDPQEIEKERGVILEEYNMYEDMPIHKVINAFYGVCFGDTPLGRTIVGTKELISSVTQEQFKTHFQNLYTPDNMVIAVAGKFDAEQLEKKIGDIFGSKTGKKAYNYLPAVINDRKKILITKDTEQAHIIVGYANKALTEREEYAADLLSVILGGNMSSRMFLKIREEMGLAYYVSSGSTDYDGANVFYTRAGVSINQTQSAITNIIEQYNKALEGVSLAEHEKAKAYMIGQQTLALEDCYSYAAMIGVKELLHNQKMDFNKFKQMVSSIALDEVNSVARTLINPDALKLAVIGPYSSDDFVLG